MVIWQGLRAFAGGEAGTNATIRVSAQKQDVSLYYWDCTGWYYLGLVIFRAIKNGFRYAMFSPWLEDRVS